MVPALPKRFAGGDAPEGLVDMSEREQLTRMLNEIGEGDAESVAPVMEIIYDELRRMATRHMASERPGQTLQSTALVHEVYLRLMGRESLHWASRAQFFRFAAECMQRILIDTARRRSRHKRGGGRMRLSLDVLDLAAVTQESELAADVLALDCALERLKTRDARMHEIVLLRFYAGLKVEDVAELLDVSPRTIKRDWMLARAWLYAAINQADATGDMD